jgi:hypothetical protein
MLLLYTKCLKAVLAIKEKKTNVMEREKPKRNNLTVCVLPVYR